MKKDPVLERKKHSVLESMAVHDILERPMDDRAKQLLTLGREQYEQRNFKKAAHYFEQLLDRGEKFADVYNMMGVIHHDEGEFEAAKKAFEHALLINPSYTEASLNLAVTYNDLGRYQEAKRIYNEATHQTRGAAGEIDPFAKGKIANLHAEIAQAYGDAGMLAEAMHEYHRALALCPHFVDLRMRLAALYRQQGDLGAAEQELKEALLHRPAYAPARVALGVLCLLSGDTASAIREWETVLEDDPGNKSAEMYIRVAREEARNSAPPAAGESSGDA